VSAGAKISSKDWGQENWQRLLGRLSEETASLGVGLVLIGAKDEYQLSEWVSSGWDGEKVNLCGATNPRVAASVISKAVLFLGHDSGPMHLAAAVGTPCVAVFSAQNKPGEWFPHGSQHAVLYHKTDCYGCRLATCPLSEKICMTSITVEEVLTAARTQLQIKLPQTVAH
jgi:ADP-heptose:LPS heptosyltransferase